MEYAEDNYRCDKSKQRVQLRPPDFCCSRTDDPDEKKHGNPSTLGVKIEDRVVRLLRHGQRAPLSALSQGSVNMWSRAESERCGVEALIEGVVPQMQAKLRRAFGCRTTLAARE